MKILYLVLISLTAINIFALDRSKSKNFSIKPQEQVRIVGFVNSTQIPDDGGIEKRAQMFKERSENICKILGLTFVKGYRKEENFSKINFLCRNTSGKSLNFTLPTTKQNDTYSIPDTYYTVNIFSLDDCG